jgi:hypothetical protein
MIYRNTIFSVQANSSRVEKGWFGFNFVLYLSVFFSDEIAATFLTLKTASRVGVNCVSNINMGIWNFYSLDYYPTS